MKLVRVTSFDSLDASEIVDAPKPAPGEGQTLIRVAACGVGYVEALVASGRYQVKPQLPFTPGIDVAGVVEAIGAGGAPQGVTVGDRVIGVVSGGFAEYALAASGSVTKLPEGASFEEGASFLLNYVTGLHALQDRANLKPGERLLVLGAAGGTGSAAVQIGKLMGANVIACASTPEKRDFAKAQGADVVIDANPEGWRDRLKEATGGRGPDVIFDPVCGPLFELSFRSLAWRGRHLVIGFVGGDMPSLKSNLPLMKGASLVGVDVRQFNIFEPDQAQRNRAQLTQWLAEGKLKPPVGRVFPFDEFRNALKFALSGQVLGKVVLKLA